MTVKDNRVDVRYHMNTQVKEDNNFDCTLNYQKLKRILISREIRKKYGSHRNDGYFPRVLSGDYPSKYIMEC